MGLAMGEELGCGTWRRACRSAGARGSVLEGIRRVGAGVSVASRAGLGGGLLPFDFGFRIDLPPLLVGPRRLARITLAPAARGVGLRCVHARRYRRRGR